MMIIFITKHFQVCFDWRGCSGLLIVISILHITELKPSMKDLANQVIPTVCPMWRDIGLQLNLDISILNEIRANCQGDVRECCTIMFDKWLKQDTEASWCTVLSACRRVKDNLSSGPDEPCTKDHIKVLTLLISTLPVFLTTL